MVKGKATMQTPMTVRTPATARAVAITATTATAAAATTTTTTIAIVAIPEAHPRRLDAAIAQEAVEAGAEQAAAV